MEDTGQDRKNKKKEEAKELRKFKAIKRKELENELSELNEFDKEQTYWTREAFEENLNNFDSEVVVNIEPKQKQSQSIIQRYLEMQIQPRSATTFGKRTKSQNNATFIS